MRFITSLLLLLLISSAAFAASGSGNITNAIMYGGINTSDGVFLPASDFSWFTLDFPINITGGQWSNFYKNGTAYQVPVGSTFHMVRYCASSAAATNTFQFISSTAKITPNNTNNALTGPIYQSGVAANYMEHTSATINVDVCKGFTYSFPSGSWPGVQVQTTDSNFTIKVFGKETTP